MLSKEEFEKMTGLRNEFDPELYRPSKELIELRALKPITLDDFRKDPIVSPLIVIRDVALKSCLCVPAYHKNEEFESIINDAIRKINEIIYIASVIGRLGFLDDEGFKDTYIIKTISSGTADEICSLAIEAVAGELVDESILEVTPDYPHNAPFLTTAQCAALCMGTAIKSAIPIVELALMLREI